MAQDPEALVGRTRELSALTAALQDARAGSGSLWFVSGEPGIGKSRLCEELTRSAIEAGFDVHWGRCWEAGGAPAFWPFIQVLRGVLRDPDAGLLSALTPASAALLGELLPELRGGLEPQEAPPTLAPEQARFHILDAVATLLCEAARARPLLLVLDDLHAADLSSVQLLDFLAGLVRGAPIVVVGSYRDVEMERGEVGGLLAGVAARARSLALRRLSRDEVSDFLRAQLDTPPDEALVQAVFAATEGNPLFMVETARLLIAHGPGLPAQPGAQMPTSIKRVIEERLQRLSTDAREVLELASVLGREPDRALLAILSGRDAAELAIPLAEAVDAAVLLEHAPGQYRFTHILLREVLHHRIPEARRQALHGAVAEALQAHPEHGRPLSEIAHHHLEAGAGHRSRAATATRRAAEQAEAQLAFGDAASLYRQALQSLGPDADAESRIALLLGLGRAQMIAGSIEQGRESCLQAAAAARVAGLPEALARAALAFGRVFVIARVDHTLVALLREALLALDPGDSALRARVMARLAAAEQPAPDPAGPIAMAREAIAMARRVGTASDLLATLRAGCSALADLTPPRVRAPLNREHETLALSLREPAEALRGAMRLSFDLFEQGDVAGARGAIGRCARYAGQLDHPHYRWRVHALQAMSAIFDGRFDDAEAEAAAAAALGARAGDPNVETVLASQQLAIARLRGDDSAAVELSRRVDAHYDGNALDAAVRDVILRGELVRARQPAALATGLSAETVDRVLASGDRTLLEHLTELVVATRDRALAEQVLALLDAGRDDFLHNGMLGMTWGGPLSVSVARLLHLLERDDEAAAAFAHAVAVVQATGSAPHEAWVRYERARCLCERGQARAAAEELRRASEMAETLGLHGLIDRIADLRARSSADEAGAAPPQPLSPALEGAAAPSLHRDGELWWLVAGGRRLALKDTKGVRMLAQLIAEPGRPFHVLQLVTPGGGSDTGDAGEMIDDSARNAYRARMAELRDTLREAEAHNDLAQAEKAREELEALGAELAHALGLGARSRRAGSAVERARVNVQRRLKDAIRRVGEQDAALERHLSWAVRTGTFCTYEPQG